MKKLKRYTISLEGEQSENGERIGWDKTAFTAQPAVKIKGLMFRNEEVKKLFFADEPKMRLAAPLIIPMVAYRKGEEENGKKEDDYETEFTQEVIEQLHADLMSNPEHLKDFFNNDHDTEIVPAYLLEIWIVEDPETDKAFKTYGVKVPKGTLFGVAQITDRDYYDKLLREDKTGFSIEGFFGLKIQMSEMKKDFADVLVLNNENKVLMLKRTETDEFEPGTYGFPGGKIEPGEDSLTAAIRELFEETGIKAEDLIKVDLVDNGDGTTSCYYVTKTDQMPEVSEEHTGFMYVNSEEMEKLPLILGQFDRFSQLYKKAVKLINANSMKLPDGEHEIDGKIYVVKDGEVVEIKDKQEMADEEPEAKKEEMQEDEPEAAPMEDEKPLKKEDIISLVQETVKPMIDEAMKAVIDQVVSNEEEKEEAKEEMKKEKFNDQGNGIASTFAFLAE